MRTRTRLAAPLVGLAWALVACGGSGGDRAGRFCAEVKADQPTITATVADPTGVDHVVDRFHDLEQTAPLAIEDDWQVLTQLVETAAAIAPGDTAGQDPPRHGRLRSRPLGAERRRLGALGLRRRPDAARHRGLDHACDRSCDDHASRLGLTRRDVRPRTPGSAGASRYATEVLQFSEVMQTRFPSLT